MRALAAALLALVAAGCTSVMPAAPPRAQAWLTTADETSKLAEQPLLAPAGAAIGDEQVTIDPAQRFQKMHGFGAAMTDSTFKPASARLSFLLPRH